ncbi:MAG: SAM-dependent DNA methyltransferase [Deltaproteobacteria bacterium]|nr:SAM-dependent DNA methyltransferase [Deltaproteobacteria bacterium]
MGTKHEVLAQLKRDELLQLVDRFGVVVTDRRSKDGLVDALATASKIALADALAGLSRSRLKDMCRALGLHDDGREKALLIERITTKSSVAADPRPRARKTNGKPTVADIAIAPGETLSPAKLEAHLWSAADILRGSIDSSDYKNFIFGLLFLKRLSDRFDEECETIVAAGSDPEDRDEHEFFVPPRARWKTIQKAAQGIGEVLNKACAVVEEENAKALEGVLLGMDFNDERKLGDAKQRDAVLARLVQHFSLLDLRNASLSEPDMLGRAYEYLIERFADDAGKKGGEFYTPRKVVQLIAELLAPTERMRICDPTCGSGGMLIECANYVSAHGGNPKNLSLFGQEKNLGTWSIAKLNMLLHGIRDFRIEKGDTIRDPKLVEGGALMLFDRVCANPPFSLDEWGREYAERDPWGRFRFGVPPKGKGDLAFVQHMIATLTTKGMLAVVMPHGVLFRGAAEGDIRRGIIEDDLVEAVIGLPPNLFYGTGIPAAILVINRAKPANRKGKILFIEASRQFREGSAQNYLRDEDVKKIAAAFAAFKDAEKYARVVPVEEVRKNDFNLNITRYVATAEAAEVMDVGEALRRLREAEAARDVAKAEMDRLLKEMGLDG